MKTTLGGLGAFCPDTTSKPGARAIAPRAALRSSVRRVTSFGISIFAPLSLIPDPLFQARFPAGGHRNTQAYLGRRGIKIFDPLAYSRLSQKLPNLCPPSQERADTTGRLKQRGVFNKCDGRGSLLGFRHEQIGQGRLAWLFAFGTPVFIGDLGRQYSFDFLREGMSLVERAADEQFFDLSVDQGFECLVQPDYSQSSSAILMHQPLHLFRGSLGFLLL